MSTDIPRRRAFFVEISKTDFPIRNFDRPALGRLCSMLETHNQGIESVKSQRSVQPRRWSNRTEPMNCQIIAQQLPVHTGGQDMLEAVIRMNMRANLQIMPAASRNIGDDPFPATFNQTGRPDISKSGKIKTIQGSRSVTVQHLWMFEVIHHQGRGRMKVRQCSMSIGKYQLQGWDSQRGWPLCPRRCHVKIDLGLTTTQINRLIIALPDMPISKHQVQRQTGWKFAHPMGHHLHVRSKSERNVPVRQPLAENAQSLWTESRGCQVPFAHAGGSLAAFRRQNRLERSHAHGTGPPAVPEIILGRSRNFQALAVRFNRPQQQGLTIGQTQKRDRHIPQINCGQTVHLGRNTPSAMFLRWEIKVNVPIGLSAQHEGNILKPQPTRGNNTVKQRRKRQDGIGFSGCFSNRAIQARHRETARLQHQPCRNSARTWLPLNTKSGPCQTACGMTGFLACHHGNWLDQAGNGGDVYGAVRQLPQQQGSSRSGNCDRSGQHKADPTCNAQVSRKAERSR